jgi:hypothetical protein
MTDGQPVAANGDIAGPAAEVAGAISVSRA